MKESTTELTVESSQAFKEFSFGIKESGLAHILGILRSKIYSNKIQACLREVSSNALDSMIETGRGNQPIEVTLPTAIDQNLKVRDFGTGLSIEEVSEVYIQYGESTKRNSNKSLGCLGLGSKVCFCYGDSFLVTSWFEGYKTIYNAYIDPTRIGKLAVLSREKTIEPDGIEITMAVKDGDCERFAETAQELFKFWKVKPIIHGAELNLTRSEPAYSGNGWAVYRGQSPLAVMGGVPYAISASLLEDLTEKERHFLALGLEMEFKIGEIDMAVSREQVEWTDKTKAAISKKIKLANKEMVETAKKAIANATSFFEATWAYGLLPDDVRKSVQLEFQGLPILHGFFNGWKENVAVIYWWTDYKGKVKRRSEGCITPSKTYWIADCKYVRARVKKLFEGMVGEKEVYVIEGYDPKAIKEWAEVNKIDLNLFKKLSTIDVPKREKLDKDASEARKQVKGINIWGACSGHGRHVKLSDCVEPCEIGETYDCYAIAENREISHYRYSSFGHRASEVELATGKFKVAIIRRNKLADMKVPTFDTFCKARLEAKIKETGACETKEAAMPYHLVRSASEIRKALPGHDLSKMLRNQRDNPHKDLIQTARHFGLHVETNENKLTELKEAVLKRYPILADLGYNVEAEAIIETVKALDAYQSVKDAETIVETANFSGEGKAVAA